MLETLSVVVIVAAAIAYLTSVFVRAARGKGGCSSCGCGSSKISEPNLGKRYDLISLGTKSPDAPK